MEILSHNLANTETPGYRADDSLFTAVPQAPVQRLSANGSATIGVMGLGTVMHGTHTSTGQGDLESTGRPLDVALSGSGFLAVERHGGTAYTRQGILMTDDVGRLTTAGGLPVLSDQGQPIFLPPGESRILNGGQVSVNGATVAILGVWEFPDPATLAKDGDLLLLATAQSGDPAPATETVLYQGFRESSNVNLVDQAIRMTTVVRAYEANQRVLRAQDETLGLATREVGRV